MKVHSPMRLTHCQHQSRLRLRQAAQPAVPFVDVEMATLSESISEQPSTQPAASATMASSASAAPLSFPIGPPQLISAPSAPATSNNRKRTALISMRNAANYRKPVPAFQLDFDTTGALAHGTSPFKWLNSVDPSSPLNFQFLERNELHPSVTAQLNRSAGMRASAQWGCDCPDGVCQPSTCPCAHAGENQYTRQGKLTFDGKPLHTHVECWEHCSCACNEHSSAAARTDTPLASEMRQVVSPSESASPEQYDHSLAAESVSATVPARPSLSPTDDVTMSTTDEPLVLTTAAASPGFSAPSPRVSRCFNRVVQLAPINPALQLVVYRDPEKGWALRTLTRISKGQYVCEYIGEVIHEYLSEMRGAQLSVKKKSNYLFTPSMLQSHSSGGARSAAEPEYNIDEEPFSIDSSLHGHLARFINHSCEPNLVSLSVYIEHRGEVRLPRVALFAKKQIEAGSELTMHYGYRKEMMQSEFLCRCDACKLDEWNTITQLKQRHHKEKRVKRTHAPSGAAADNSSRTLGESLSEPLSPVPLPAGMLLDSSIPLPSAEQLHDRSSIFFGTQRAATAGARCFQCASCQTRLAPGYILSSHVEYVALLKSLVGQGRCIPIGESCCLLHYNSSRVALATFVLQQQFPANINWHQMQLEMMRAQLEMPVDVYRHSMSELAHTGLMQAIRAKQIKREREGERVEPLPRIPAACAYFSCSVCRLSFASRALLCAHRARHFPSLSPCDTCFMQNEGSRRVTRKTDLASTPVRDRLSEFNLRAQSAALVSPSPPRPKPVPKPRPVAPDTSRVLLDIPSADFLPLRMLRFEDHTIRIVEFPPSAIPLLPAGSSPLMVLTSDLMLLFNSHKLSVPPSMKYWIPREAVPRSGANRVAVNLAGCQRVVTEAPSGANKTWAETVLLPFIRGEISFADIQPYALDVPLKLEGAESSPSPSSSSSPSSDVVRWRDWSCFRAYVRCSTQTMQFVACSVRIVHCEVTLKASTLAPLRLISRSDLQKWFLTAPASGVSLDSFTVWLHLQQNSIPMACFSREGCERFLQMMKAPKKKEWIQNTLMPLAATDQQIKHAHRTLHSMLTASASSSYASAAGAGESPGALPHSPAVKHEIAENDEELDPFESSEVEESSKSESPYEEGDEEEEEEEDSDDVVAEADSAESDEASFDSDESDSSELDSADDRSSDATPIPSRQSQRLKPQIESASPERRAFSAACSPAVVRTAQTERVQHNSDSSPVSAVVRKTEHKQQINPLSRRMLAPSEVSPPIASVQTPPRAPRDAAVPWSSLSFLSAPATASSIKIKLEPTD